jgi:LPS export ABC transporter permease LptG
MKFLWKLDRYVSVYFLTSYLICFVFFLGLFIVVDLVPKVDDILESAPAAAQRGESLFYLTLEFYLVKTPEIFLMVAPYLTVMAAMFCLSRLRKNNELVPMIMSGISLYRVIRPIFVLSGLLLVSMILIQEYLAPACAEKRMLSEAFLIDHEDKFIIDQQIFWDQEGKEIMVSDYDVATRVIRSAYVSYLEQRSGREFNCSIRGNNLRWLGPEEEAWTIEDGILEIKDLSEPSADLKREPIKKVRTDITPSDIIFQEKKHSDLTFAEIQRAYARNPQDRRMKILLHYHITFPISNLLLLLLGVPFVLRHERRSNFLGLALALLICGGYFVLDVIMRELGTKHQMNPILAAWFATIFCGMVGVYLFDGIKT